MVMPLKKADIVALQDRYLSDIENIIRESIGKPKKRIVMLSGGTDSFLLVAALRNLMPNDKLYTVTIQGLETDDSRGAESVSRYFNTIHSVQKISVEDILDNIEIIKGKGYTKLRTFMSHICYQLCLESYGVGGCNVYSGHGGEILYGNNPSIYKDAERIAKEENCSVDDAKTRVKINYYKAKTIYNNKMKKRHLKKIVDELGGTLIMPYQDESLSYISEVPYSIISPFDKKFVKDAIRRRYKLGDIVERTRIGMQDGTGLYRPFKSKLKKIYKSLGCSAIDIVKKLSE